jgi:16S rRNA (adenine1518-N6/adenine1519-N6)-dimethyltransferase
MTASPTYNEDMPQQGHKFTTGSRLGQNFLVDDAARRAVVDALGDLSETTVVEIGPGHGALTELLVPRCKQLIAIEVDPVLAAENRAYFAAHDNFTLIEQDFLTADLAAIIAPAQKTAVIGNLPYYITSDILLKLTAAHANVSRAVLMVQREVAERVAAAPGTSDYGLLSATVQTYATVDLLFTLPPSVFSPPPEVYSSVLRLHFAPRFAELQLNSPEDIRAFDAFLRTAFAQKRKMLRNNLRAAGHSAEALDHLTASGIDLQARAEALDLKTMAGIFHALKKFTQENPGQF